MADPARKADGHGIPRVSAQFHREPSCEHPFRRQYRYDGPRPPKTLQYHFNLGTAGGGSSSTFKGGLNGVKGAVVDRWRVFLGV